MATEPVVRDRTSITVVLGHKTAREIRFEGKTPYAFEILMKLDEMLSPEMLEKVGLPEDVNEMVLKRRGIEMEIFTEVKDGDVIYTESRADNTPPALDADDSDSGLSLLMKLSEEEEKTSGPKIAQFLKKITKMRKNLSDPLLGGQENRPRLTPPRPRGQEVGKDSLPAPNYQPPSYLRATSNTPTDGFKRLTFEDSKSAEGEPMFPPECQKSPVSLDVSTERGSGRFPAELFKSSDKEGVGGRFKFLTDPALLSDDSSQPGSSKTDEDKDIDVLDRIPELPRGGSGPLSALHSASTSDDDSDEELGSPSSTGPSGKITDSLDPHILHAQKILDDENPEQQICKLLHRERQAKQDKRFLGNKLQQHRGMIEDLRKENQRLHKERTELREENQRLDTTLFALQCDTDKNKKRLGRMTEILSKTRTEAATCRRENIHLQEKNESLEKRVKDLLGESGVKVMGVMLPRHMPSEVDRLELAFKAVSSLKKKLQERQLEILKSQITCSICWDNSRATALIPCGHCFCHPCAARVAICPICRKHIRSRQKLFY